MLSIADPVISWARSFFCLASSSGGSIAVRAVEGPLQAGAGIEQRRLEVVGVGDRQALADVRRRAPHAATSATSTTPAITSGSSRMRRITAAEGDEAAGADLHAQRRAHDVLEAVGLVEHDDVVFGKDRPAGRDVEAVEVRVDDDDVGDRRSSSRQLGEARLAHRAAAGAGALVAADGDRPQDRLAGSEVELGDVAGRRRAPPTWRSDRGRRAARGDSSPSSSWPCAASPGAVSSRSRCRHT